LALLLGCIGRKRRQSFARWWIRPWTRAETLAVLSRPGTTPLEPRLYFTLSASPCHALPALLAREPPTATRGLSVGRPGIGDGGDNYQDYAVYP
jgi:hypothetical protein